MAKKIPVSDFISDKKLDKIKKIIDKSSNVEDAYDKIENLIIEDYHFKVKDLGTNRIIFIHKKYKNCVIKIAGDSHGIEANYREFYNGDLDEKRITESYSISKNGTFLVQERVTPFTSDMMKKYKKEVRKVLSHLEDKLLLVDCKLSNFKNFGMRRNGDIVLLDHGDTIPLTMYDNGKIVNIVEENNVSLRCKAYKKGTATSKNPKPCDGKLVYSKDYDYFICKKCGTKSHIHDAYKEFYTYSKCSSDDSALLNLNDDFDPDEYARQIQASIEQYAQDTMNKCEGDKKMDKHIKGQKCIQIKDYWIPTNISKPMASAKLLAVKRGDLSPVAYLKAFGFDPDDYKIKESSKTTEDIEKGENEMKFKDKKMNKRDNYNNERNINNNDFDPEEAKIIATKIVEMVKNGKAEDVYLSNSEYRSCNGKFKAIHMNDLFESFPNIYKLKNRIKSELFNIEDVQYSFYDENNFYVRINNYDNDHKKYNRDNYTPYKKSNEKESNGKPEIVDIIPISKMAKMEFTDINDEECITHDGYFIPVDLLNNYFKPNSGFELPSGKSILEAHNYDPELYQIETDVETDEEYPDMNDVSSENETFTENILEDDNVTDLVDDDDYMADDIDTEAEEFRKEFITTLLNNSDKKDAGYIRISYDDMVTIMEELGVSEFYIDENGKLNSDAIEYIQSFDEVSDISDYIAGSAYDILINNKDDRELNYFEKVNKFITDSLNPGKNIVTNLIELIDWDILDETGIYSINYIIDTLELLSFIELENKYTISNPVLTRLKDRAYLISRADHMDITSAKRSLSLMAVEIVTDYFNSIIDSYESSDELWDEFIQTIDEYNEYSSLNSIKTIDDLKDIYTDIISRFNNEDENKNEVDSDKNNLVKDSSNNDNSINDAIKILIKNAQTITLDLEDVMNVDFEIKNVTNRGIIKIAKINLYTILKDKLS